MTSTLFQRSLLRGKLCISGAELLLQTFDVLLQRLFLSLICTQPLMQLALYLELAPNILVQLRDSEGKGLSG